MTNILPRASPGNGNRIVVTAGVIIALAGTIVFWWLKDVNGSVRDLRDRTSRLEGSVASLQDNQQATFTAFQRENEKQLAEYRTLWEAIRRIDSVQPRIDEFLRRFDDLESGMRSMQSDVTGLKLQITKIAALLEKEQSRKGGRENP